jgi:hypothetical protein
VCNIISGSSFFSKQPASFYISPEKREEEQELLDSVIENLREFHSACYEFEDHSGGDLSIKLRLSGDVYRKSDYYDNRPLVLVKVLVQEDFIMIQKNEEGKWCFIGGVACYSGVRHWAERRKRVHGGRQQSRQNPLPSALFQGQYPLQLVYVVSQPGWNFHYTL